MNIECVIIGVLLIIGLGAYFYFIYAPVPAVPPLSAGIREGYIFSGNRKRTFLSYIPLDLSPGAPLIIALHGTGMTGKKMRQWTGYRFDELADHYKFAVVYPDGYKGNWNDCRINAPFPAKKDNIDDVAFIRDLINEFRAVHQVDTRMVFVVGFSNGGQMVLRLATEIPERIEAAAAIGANLPTPETCSCTREGKTSRLLLISGTADKINPYKGGKVTLFKMKKIGTVISALATAENIAYRNNAGATPLVSKFKQDPTRDATGPDQISWLINDRPFVQLISIAGGGHVIPQAKYRFPRMMGKTVTTFDAPMAALNFFGIEGRRDM